MVFFVSSASSCRCFPCYVTCFVGDVAPVHNCAMPHGPCYHPRAQCRCHITTGTLWTCPRLAEFIFFQKFASGRRARRWQPKDDGQPEVDRLSVDNSEWKKRFLRVRFTTASQAECCKSDLASDASSALEHHGRIHTTGHGISSRDALVFAGNSGQHCCFTSLSWQTRRPEQALQIVRAADEGCPAEIERQGSTPFRICGSRLG